MRASGICATKRSFVFVLALMGCAEQRIELDLRPFLGQQITAAVTSWGQPTGTSMKDGNTVYSWAAKHRSLLPVTTIITATQGSGRRMDFTQTSQQYVWRTVTCEIALTTDAVGTVTHYNWTGESTGCDVYVHALESRMK
jgi:hypothetical protein